MGVSRECLGFGYVGQPMAAVEQRVVSVALSGPVHNMGNSQTRVQFWCP